MRPRSCTRSTPWPLHPLLRQFNRRGDAHPRSAGAHVRQGEALRSVAPIAVRHIERGLEIGEPFARPGNHGDAYHCASQVKGCAPSSAPTRPGGITSGTLISPDSDLYPSREWPTRFRQRLARRFARSNPRCLVKSETATKGLIREQDIARRQFLHRRVTGQFQSARQRSLSRRDGMRDDFHYPRNGMGKNRWPQDRR